MKIYLLKIFFSVLNFFHRSNNFLHKFFTKISFRAKKKIIFSVFEGGEKYPLCEVLGNVDSNSIVWTCWLQGLDNAPVLVRKCISSFSKIPGKKVIVIDNNNYSDYLKLPEEIIIKLERGIISYTAFSEVIRMELLATYGGMWLDATMYIPIELKINCDNYSFFSPVEKENVSNDELFGLFPMFFLFSVKNYAPIKNIRNYLINYWVRYDSQVDYFLIDYMFRYEFEKNNHFKKDVLNNPPLGKNLHSLEVFYMDSVYEEKIKLFIHNDPLGAFKLNYKNKHDGTLGTLYTHILFSDN